MLVGRTSAGLSYHKKNIAMNFYLLSRVGILVAVSFKWSVVVVVVVNIVLATMPHQKTRQGIFQSGICPNAASHFFTLPLRTPVCTCRKLF